jgi:hypothetical protein
MDNGIDKFEDGCNNFLVITRCPCCNERVQVWCDFSNEITDQLSTNSKVVIRKEAK